MVGFVPLFGADGGRRAKSCDQHESFNRRRKWFIEHRPDLVAAVGPMVTPGAQTG